MALVGKVEPLEHRAKQSRKETRRTRRHKLIARIWHGWTRRENADAYEALLEEEIFVGIRQREIAGFQGIQLLRRDLNTEVEFITIMSFESIEAIHVFAGSDYDRAVVPPKAGALLERFDERSQHYEIRTPPFPRG